MEDLFKKYLKEKDVSKYEKSYAWKTAIGLQKVDGLSPSDYLIKLANDNINNELDFEEAHRLINNYYVKKNECSERTQEADKVSVRIAEILSEKSFTFSIVEYISIHKRLFEGIYESAGKLRKYNILKEEPKITLYDASIKINKSLRTVKNIVKKLEEEEIVIREGSKKTGSWKVLR